MNLWHRFTHWMMSDFLTLEERAIMREEARRLRLRTDLQERRAAMRRERQEAWQLVGTWTCHHRYDDKHCQSIFYLEQRRDGKYRRIRPGVCTLVKTGEVIHTYSTIKPFFEAQKIWTGDLLPWLQGTYKTSRLSKLEGIDLI